MVAVVLAGPDAVAATTELAAPAARATQAVASQTPTGQDVSWPQCPPGRGGYGLPMPPRDAAFVVIGLTAGRGFTANPCVASQAAWAKLHRVPSSAYLVPTYPTRAEMRRWGAHGPQSPTRLRQRVYNVGWAEARAALAVLARSGLRARSVWIDVEASRTRPWSADTDANTVLVRGVAAAVRRAGYLPGLYTNSSSWTGFMDGAALALPEWRTVGPRTRSTALAACTARPLNGGRVLMVQYWTSTVDRDVVCPVLASSAARARWFRAP
jgi:hypothetical protein